MTDREELERFAAVVRQYVNSQGNYKELSKAWPGESRAARQAMLNGLEYVEKLKSHNSEYVSQAKSCRSCKHMREDYSNCDYCAEAHHSYWEPE